MHMYPLCGLTLYVCCQLTLNSDDGRCGVGATENGSTGVQSSLRC